MPPNNALEPTAREPGKMAALRLSAIVRRSGRPGTIRKSRTTRPSGKGDEAMANERAVANHEARRQASPR